MRNDPETMFAYPVSKLLVEETRHSRRDFRRGHSGRDEFVAIWDAQPS